MKLVNVKKDRWDVVGLLLIVTIASSWVNHLIVCFTNESWGFLIAGAIAFPIGVVHGFGSMVGFW